MDEQKGEGITGVWLDCGFRLNLKYVLYLKNQCLTEKQDFFNSQYIFGQ